MKIKLLTGLLITINSKRGFGMGLKLRHFGYERLYGIVYLGLQYGLLKARFNFI